MGVLLLVELGRHSRMHARAMGGSQRFRSREREMGLLARARRWRAMIAVALCVQVTSSCSPGYVLRGAWEEGKILGRRRPIARVIADPAQTPETRRKLRLVLAAREFGRDAL